jgi:opacity protein-like surface antigen
MLRKILTMTWVLLLLAVPMQALAHSQGLTQPGEPPADSPDHLYLSPKNGQTQEQQWADRYACHSWAKGQSAFDPANKADGAAPDEHASRRAQYRRAMTACLEARGYSVRYAAGAPPSAAPPPSAGPPPYAQRPGTPVEPASRRVIEPKYHPLSVQIEGGYSVTTGTTNQYLDGGSNVGLGLTWFPISALPLGFRLDGSYSSFRQSSRSLSLASQALGTDVSFGHARLYGGDLDIELDLRMGPHVKGYFFGGAGRYRAQTTFKQVSYQPGVGCDWWECFYGYFPYDTTVQRNTSGWLNSWNAGMGFEFALASPARFFIEARYLRIGPATSRMDFVPIRVGLRF